jgi:hypothetical protein
MLTGRGLVMALSAGLIVLAWSMEARGDATSFVPQFIRGDVDADGKTDITDPMLILQHLFLLEPARLQ